MCTLYTGHASAVVWFDFCLLSSSSFQHWSEFGAIWYSILEVSHACDGREEEKKSRYSFFLSLFLPWRAPIPLIVLQVFARGMVVLPWYRGLLKMADERTYSVIMQFWTWKLVCTLYRKLVR